MKSKITTIILTKGSQEKNSSPIRKKGKKKIFYFLIFNNNSRVELSKKGKIHFTQYRARREKAEESEEEVKNRKLFNPISGFPRYLFYIFLFCVYYKFGELEDAMELKIVF